MGNLDLVNAKKRQAWSRGSSTTTLDLHLKHQFPAYVSAWTWQPTLQETGAVGGPRDRADWKCS